MAMIELSDIDDLEKDAEKCNKKGLSAKLFGIVMGVVLAVFIGVLILTTVFISRKAAKLNDFLELSEVWRGYANSMQASSDFLTEQVRFFVELGDRTYLDNYFREADSNKNREKALESLGNSLSDKSEAYEALEAALEQSNTLMKREHYAMRLKIEAMGDDLTDYPAAIGKVALTAEDLNLSKTKKAELARMLVYDNEYMRQKNIIGNCVDECFLVIDKTLDTMQAEELRTLKSMLWVERLIIVIISLLFIVMMVSLIKGIIRPLYRAEVFLQNEKLLPVEGARELRFVARAYNIISKQHALSEKQLKYSASHDFLTKALNRESMEKILEKIEQGEYAILFLDIDRFKEINDENGHKAGDKVLKKLADSVRKNFRQNDYLCRVGGDEFIVVMPATGEDSRDIIAERIEKINAELADGSDDVPAASISVGVAFGSGKYNRKVYKNADMALYERKQAGRGGVTFFDDME